MVSRAAAQTDGVGGLQWITEMKRLKTEQDWTARLETARRGVAEILGLEDLRVHVLILALGALGDFVNQHGSSPALDAEAEGYYGEGVGLTDASSEERAILEHTAALYYSKSKRNGRALPFLFHAHDHWEATEKIEELVANYGSVAAAYGDMGQLLLEEQYRRKALSLAQERYIIGLRPKSSQAWLSYLDLIEAQMDDVAKPGRGPEVLELWELAEPVRYAYTVSLFSGLHKLAFYLTLTGDHELAEQYLQRAIEELGKVVTARPQLEPKARRDLQCAQAHIELERGRQHDAVLELGQCLEMTVAMGVEPDMNFYAKFGKAKEKTGDLDGAIESYQRAVSQAEVLRGSYGLADRATFFRSLSRRAYWGLIRSYSRRAQSSRSVDDLYLALRSSELVRARQIGEILDPESEPAISVESLEILRGELRPEELVLDLVATDTGVVVLAFDQQRWVATVVELDMTAFGARLKELAAELSHPGSSPESIRIEFAEIGKLLLGPVAPVLEDKTSLVVLPDGVLNLVPFELLVDPETGVPLFDDRVVRTAISLRHAINLQKRTGAGQGDSLFAVADPIYQSTYEIEGLSTEETRAAARGSDYLGYFAQLPETRTEVQSIARLFPEASVSLVLGREASESTVKAADLSSYRFVHMATHGILGGEVPGVAEPALVLSEEPDQDGFLTASEASELSLDAELTVLSACKTGSGEYVTGEGVMGMSRAFIVGGSRNVLVSLWAVDSLATESLMVKFYGFLRGGMAAPQALREAKMSLIAEYLQREGTPQTDMHPFYWAAFVLIGN